MSIRKLISLTLALVLALGLLTFAAADEAAPIRVASMMGPTSMGLVKLMTALPESVQPIVQDLLSNM